MVKKSYSIKKQKENQSKKSNIISTTVSFVPKRDKGDGDDGGSWGSGKGLVAGFIDGISFKVSDTRFVDNLLYWYSNDSPPNT